MNLRKIDALIAEHVMGIDTSEQDDYEYEVTEGQRKCWDGEPDLTKDGWEEYRTWERFDYTEERYWRRPIRKKPYIKSYSSDISAAWEVWEETDIPTAIIWHKGKLVIGEPVGGLEFSVYVTADTAPLAICLAALKEKGIDYESNNG